MSFDLHTLDNDRPELGDKSSDALTRMSNIPVGAIDRNLTRKPDRYIYLFTVSKRGFTIERPPLFPRIKVPACGPQERYKLFQAIPDPVIQPIMDWDKGKNVAAPDPPDGVRVAVDLIDPNNLANSLDWVCPEYAVAEVQQGSGCNLANQGLFFDYTPIPSEQELVKAEKRRHDYYERLRMNADMLEKTNPKELALAVFFNNDYHQMADYFGLEYSWHRVMSVMASCPNCGDKIKQGVGFHKTDFGVCIIDWQAAVKAGIKKYEDVPDELKWRDGEKRGPGRPKSSGVNTAE